MAATLQLHALAVASRANGPGLRAVIWTQGCALGCVGCFYPQTHAFNGGEPVAVDELFERLAARADRIEGITISGGEPLQQPRPLRRLLKRLRAETRLSIIVFTGYTWEEVQAAPDRQSLLDCIDVLIAGRYDESQRAAQRLIGSANQTVHFLTDRYTISDFASTPAAEIIITADGAMMMSGIDPLRW